MSLPLNDGPWMSERSPCGGVPSNFPGLSPNDQVFATGFLNAYVRWLRHSNFYANLGEVTNGGISSDPGKEKSMSEKVHAVILFASPACGQQ